MALRLTESEARLYYDQALLDSARRILIEKGMESPTPQEISSYIKTLRDWQNIEDPREALVVSYDWMFLQHRAGILMYKRIGEGDVYVERG